LGTDMLPALALGAEPPDRELMQRPPRPAGERLLAWPVLRRAYLWLGVLQAAAALGAFFFVLNAGGWQYGEALAPRDPLYLQATTACLAAIVLAQVANIFSCRDALRSAFRIPLRANPLLLQAVALEILLLGLIVFTPVGQAAFGTAPPPLAAWPIMVALAVCFGLLEELRKAVLRSRT
ncbi:MAG TPA: cation-translocating P-type ATPase C-terminal domain-containing protein, partial [Steroidobacteraceae bacterium]|nr:cation-translocating P-type ATPase C-terminal domain-containing protein [Steroidobacteraceae bacterium]